MNIFVLLIPIFTLVLWTLYSTRFHRGNLSNFAKRFKVEANGVTFLSIISVVSIITFLFLDTYYPDPIHFHP